MLSALNRGVKMPQFEPKHDGVYRFMAPLGHTNLVLARQNYIDVLFGYTLLKDVRSASPTDYEWTITYHTQLNGRDCFKIRWTESPNIYLTWSGKGEQLGL